MNETTTLTRPRVKREHVAETHHFTRHLLIANGPKVKTREFPAHGKLRFRVREIVVFWRNESEVEYVMVYGINNKTKLYCRKRYEPLNVPVEIKDLLGDDLKGPKK